VDSGIPSPDTYKPPPREPRRVRRHERLTRHETDGPNGMWAWTRARNPLRVALHYVVIVVARHMPSLRVKNWLYRRLGMSVGAGAAWGLEATPDVFFPDRVTVGEGAVVGYDATLLAHEFLADEYRVGQVVVEDGAMVGAGAVVLPGVRVGEGAQVAANSLVAEDVPAGETVAGVPAEPVD